MAQCLISNCKGKKYENTLAYENEIRKKKYGRLSWQTSVFANRVTSSFFLVSLRTCIHGYQQEMESGCRTVLTAVLVKEKSGEKDAELVAAVVLRRRRVRRRLFSRLLTKTRKETKTSMFQHKKKKIPTQLFVVVSPSNFRRVVGFSPTVNRHKPR